jgi:hypothetical protein
MQLKQRSSALAPLAAIAVFAISAASGADLPSNLVYVASTTAQSYSTFVGPIPIDGLSLTLPAATAEYNAAIVTLSMPNLYFTNPTSETNAMSAEISIVAPFSPEGVVSANGGIGCDTTHVASSGRKPITLVLKVPLGTTTQQAEAEWSAVFGTLNTDTFASISAILVRE